MLVWVKVIVVAADAGPAAAVTATMVPPMAATASAAAANSTGDCGRGNDRRRFVVIGGGAVVAAVKKPADFDAVILHELAHIKNRDIDQTYLALAIRRAFVVAALLPLAVLLIFTWGVSPVLSSGTGAGAACLT